MKGVIILKITKQASAGTMESSDVYVEIEPSTDGLDIHIESVVEKQFGENIKVAVYEVLKQQDIESAAVRVIDRGALECVIRARVETAVLRGREEN